MKRNSGVFRLAFCAICAGISVAALWLGAVTGLFDLTSLLVAGSVTVVMKTEAGEKFSLVAVAAAFALAIVILPDKFLAFGYLLVSGIYPIAARFLPKRGALKWLSRALVGAALTAAYFLAIKFVFTGSYDVGERYLYPFLAVGGVVLFVVYDRWLAVFERFYVARIRPRIKR